MVDIHQGSVLSPFVVGNFGGGCDRECKKRLNKRGFVCNDLVLMSEIMESLKEEFLKWRSALKSKGLKVNHEKMKVMVSGSEGKIILSRIDPM